MKTVFKKFVDVSWLETTFISAIMCSLILMVSLAQADRQADGRRHRLVVLTDIGGDPDDQQSMVRLLLYANEFDLEGLVATSVYSRVNPDLICERIEAYRRVRPNLIKHAQGYPAAD